MSGHYTRPGQLPPCSVVWHDGHPWVLDGEPGVSRLVSPRYWIGVTRAGDYGNVKVPGAVSWMSEEDMAKIKPAICHDDTENQRDVPMVADTFASAADQS